MLCNFRRWAGAGAERTGWRRLVELSIINGFLACLIEHHQWIPSFAYDHKKQNTLVNLWQFMFPAASVLALRHGRTASSVTAGDFTCHLVQQAPSRRRQRFSMILLPRP